MPIKLEKKGHAVYVPAFDLLLGIVNGEITREGFLDLNMPWIEACDALFLIGLSEGSDRESRLAKKLGKIIYTEISDIPDEMRKGETR